LLEKNLDRDENLEKPTSIHELLPHVEIDALRQLSHLAATDMSAYHVLVRENRLTLADSMLQAAELQSVQPRFLWYLVVQDLLRDTIIVDGKFHESFLRQEKDPVSSDANAQQLFALFADRIALFQQTSKDESRQYTACLYGDPKNPDTPTWVTPVPLDCDDPNTLFLHEQSCESGADISSEDTHIFPPFGETLYLADDDATTSPSARFKSRMIHQDAESYVVDGQRVWIVANYYETFNAFAVFDEEFVSFELIEYAMDRMCTFGGHTNTPHSDS
jgi:hypothetical protein